MSEACKKLHDFAYGELAESEADAFRLHLGSCETCPDALGDLLQLAAIEAEAAQPVATEAAPALDELAARRQRIARVATVAVALTALAAALAFYMKTRGDPAQPAEIALATAPTRPFEFRVAAADEHRPYEVMRSSTEQPREDISLETMAKLEKGDRARFATAHLLRRDTADAERVLSGGEASAEIENLRGVAAAMRGDTKAALAHFAKSLALSPENPRVLFNQALVYRDLDLPLAAAALFEKAAKLSDPAWAAEATKAAERLRDQSARDEYLKVYPEAIEAITSGKLIDLAAIERYPGMGRVLFYDAVRAASSTARLDELEAHAAALDRAYGSSDASETISRARRSDWKRRAGLSESYRSLMARTLDVDASSRFLDGLRRADEEEVLFGALLYATYGTGASPAQLEELAALASAIPDPWIRLLVDEQRVTSYASSGQTYRAIAVAEPALARCEEHKLAFRCTRIARDLAEYRMMRYELDAALEAANQGLHWAAIASDYYSLSSLRVLLAQLVTLGDDFDLSSRAVGRAYIDEELLASQGPCTDVYLRSLLARFDYAEKAPSSLDEYRLAAAAGHECEGWVIDPAGALDAARIVTAYGTPSDRESFVAAIDRARSAAAPEDALALDLAKGVALLGSDRGAAGVLLAETARAAGEVTPATFSARNTRAYAFATLAMSAAEAGDFAGSFRFLANEARVAPPARCAIALAATEQALVVVLGADGTARGSLAKSTAGPPVSPALAASVAACEVVDVIARPPYYGASNLLPADIAWRFVTSGKTPRAATTAAPNRLVVTDVETPPELGLPNLVDLANTKDATVLRGAAATPERVSAAMSRAQTIEIHAHGIADASEEGAFIALATGPGGDFSLTAEKIGRLQLAGQPLVILGACHAARSAAYFHEPWGLPISFLRAGAKTIIASPNPIPDSSASEFSEAVRSGLAAGLPAAVAVRDARLSWARDKGAVRGQWANDILVFERVEEIQ